jgi:hypothetical protein
VRAGWQSDLIIDLILCGPDTEDARANLRAKHNNGDPTPFLRYIAARYAAFPNVWICLCNEYEIRVPKWTAAEITKMGAVLEPLLPYPTPLSVHDSSNPLWSPDFDGARWYDHAIIQRKIRNVGRAADTIDHTWRNPGLKPRNIPVIDDELSYQGEGDLHNAGDTIEAHLGAFLGGGYGTTGFKPGNKLGHYFWGGFTPEEHTAAPSLRFLRETIDKHITFWKMAPDRSMFVNIDPDARALVWPGREIALGVNHRRQDMVAKLPAGEWSVRLFDIVARTEKEVAARASGTFLFDAPGSRASLFLFKRISSR